MKPQDLFILYHVLNCKSKNLLLSSLDLKKQGWSFDDVQMAQKRLQHVGLLQRKTAQPNFERIRLFLLEALSFWWPAGKTQSGRGLVLSLSSTMNFMSTLKTPSLVWPCDGESSSGDVIRPLWPELPELVSADRGVQEFFSWIEVLRFESHPAKIAAQAQVTRFLENVQKLGAQNYPDIEQDYLDLNEEHFEALIQYVSMNGFKALSLQKASLLTDLPHRYFMERWETDQALRLWVTGKYNEQVFQFLDPLIGKMEEMNKGHLAVVLESFLSFLETNEQYYRIHLWAYLENDAAIQEMGRRVQKSFFKSILVLFKKSKPEAESKAEFYSYLFASMWRVYANFHWVDSKSLSSSMHVVQLKHDIRNFIIRSVFEEF